MNNTPKTALDICNMALAMIGEPYPIAALNPAGLLPSRLCYMHYHPVRREVICAGKWDFAKRLVTLDGVPMVNNYRHHLPDDCIRVLAVSFPEWLLTGRDVLCPQERVRVEYLTDLEDVAAFPADFVKAFATRLAIKLCVPLTTSTTARDLLVNEYNKMMMP